MGRQDQNETPECHQQKDYHIKLYRRFAQSIVGFNNMVNVFEGNPNILEQFTKTVSRYISR
jgi:hypothetical protein